MTDTVLRVALVGAVSVPAGLIGLLMVLARSPLGTEQHEQVEQPVQFDHRHHAGDEGIDCRYCHDTVMSSPYAGIPPVSRCMGCHAQIWSESPLLEPVRAAYFQHKPLKWNRVHRLPDYVFFNHAAHVNKGIGCVSCHGRVDQMPLVEKATPLTMGWCLDCHRNPRPNQRPLEQIASMTYSPSPDDVVPKAEPRTSCTTCHR